jgi:hypothetical protein
MATHNILIQRKVAAKNIDSLNRSAVHATVDFDNGNLVSLSGLSTTDGEGEVFSAAVPATATLSDKLWMVYTPEVVVTVSGTKKFKGINVDPQDFYVPALSIMDVYKPQVGDIITMTADGLATGSGAGSAFAIAADGVSKLTWAAAAISGLTYAYLGTDYISLGSGAINSQRVAAYRFECVVV